MGIERHVEGQSKLPETQKNAKECFIYNSRYSSDDQSYFECCIFHGDWKPVTTRISNEMSDVARFLAEKLRQKEYGSAVLRFKVPEEFLSPLFNPLEKVEFSNLSAEQTHEFNMMLEKYSAK